MKIWEGYQNGINLGGWFSQCIHTKEHYDSFITEEDFKKIAGMEMFSQKVDHIRLPVDYNLVQNKDGSFIDEGFRYIAVALEWCDRYGLNMVLDLHKTIGYSFDAGEGEKGFFDNDIYQEMFYSLWEKFSEHFGNRKNIAFELLNEVAQKEVYGKWNKIAECCIGRIRRITAETPVIIGGYWNNSVHAVKDLADFDDKNIVYNIHCYEPFIFTHQGAGWIKGMPENYRCSIKDSIKQLRCRCEDITPELLADFDGVWDCEGQIDKNYFISLLKEAAEVSQKRNRLLYCGEYGVIDNALSDDRKIWMNEINKAFGYYGIGRAAWNYKGMLFEIEL